VELKQQLGKAVSLKATLRPPPRHLSVELRSGEAGGKGKCGTAERKTKPSASRRKVNACRRHDERSGVQDARLIGKCEIDKNAAGEENWDSE
jgi:hypothetical protein